MPGFTVKRAAELVGNAGAFGHERSSSRFLVALIDCRPAPGDSVKVLAATFSQKRSQSVPSRLRR